MTSSDISEWIDNDEGLYNWWRSSRQPKRAFIKANRAALTTAITDTLNGTKQPHHLAYGPQAGVYPPDHYR